jgi:hypothetical protein
VSRCQEPLEFLKTLREKKEEEWTVFDGLKKKEGRWVIEILVCPGRHCSSHVRSFKNEKGLRFHVRDVHCWNLKKQASGNICPEREGIVWQPRGICGRLITRTGLPLLTTEVKRCPGSS